MCKYCERYGRHQHHNYYRPRREKALRREIKLWLTVAAAMILGIIVLTGCEDDVSSPEVVEIWAIDSLMRMNVNARGGDMSAPVLHAYDMIEDPQILPLEAVCDTLYDVQDPRFRSLWAAETWPSFPGTVHLDLWWPGNLVETMWVSNHQEVAPFDSVLYELVSLFHSPDSMEFIGTCVYVEDSLFRTDFTAVFAGLNQQIAPRVRIRVDGRVYNTFEGQQWLSMSSSAKGQFALAVEILESYPSHKTFNWRGSGFDSLQINTVLMISLADCKGYGILADLRDLPVDTIVINQFIAQEWNVAL